MADPLIHVVYDDPSLLRALDRLLGAAGHRCADHASAAAVLQGYEPDVPGCVILDLDLPDIDGFGVQGLLAPDVPVIFLTGTGDIPGTVRAMKAGAVDFLTKPARTETLLRAVEVALGQDAAARAAISVRARTAARLARLTPRERQVLDGVAAGQLNKQSAARLGLSEKTVKVHRGRVMKKL